MTARITVITATRPKVLTKTATRSEDGSLHMRAGGQLVEGQASVTTVTSLADLARLLVGLGPNQALTYGVARTGNGPILSRDLHARRGRPAGTTTRTREQFVWPDAPGILMIDHDPHGTPLGRDDLVALIRTAAPGLADAAMLWWPSASSHICDRATGEDLTGLRGQRLYIMVQDAGDIPRAGAALVDRLWAAGHGRIDASASGAALERCPVDACVWQPERLDFAAGAICVGDLEQRRGDPVLIAGARECLDTRIAIPEDKTIHQAANEARKRAKCAAKPILDAARNDYVERQVEKLLSPSDREDDDARAMARSTILRALDHAVLAADFTIEVATEHNRFETVTVGQILDNRQRYHGRLTRDPLEPAMTAGGPQESSSCSMPGPRSSPSPTADRSFRLISAHSHRIETRRRATPWRPPRYGAAGCSAQRPRDLRFWRAGYRWSSCGRDAADPRRAFPRPLPSRRPRSSSGSGTPLESTRPIPRKIVEVDPPAKRLVRQILSLGPSAAASSRSLGNRDRANASPGRNRSVGTARIRRRHGTAGRPAGRMNRYPTIAAAPTLAQVREALERLMHAFREFPLVDAHARGALLAALLTAVIRPSLPTAPAFAIDAPVQGSGKTLLASAIAALATGTNPEIWPHTAGRDDEEVRKRLFAALRDGTTALVWDNVTGILDSAALAAAITAPHLRDRVLGRSESLGIPNRALLVLTGNNLCPAGDLPRRLVPVRIDPGTDAPFSREFDLDPLAHVLEYRMELVAAALTLMRGWLSSGAPRAAGRMASFDAWDDVVRQTVTWIGTEVAAGHYGDPLELVVRAQGNDPEQESLFGLLEALSDVFRDLWFTAKDVRERAQRGRDGYNATADESALAEAIVDIIGDRAVASTKSVGRMLRFRSDRVVLGRRLVSRPHRNVREFRVETVNDPGPCRFGRFGRFESSDIESTSDTPVAGEGVQSSAASSDDSEPAESNRPKRPNRHPADDPYDWGQW